MYYAHSNEEGQYQTVEEHLKNVGELSAMFSKEFGAEHLGFICGILHDVGKNSIEFQNRLLKGGEKVDHSTAGALVVEKLLGKTFKILLGYVISGHHSGLMDYGSEEGGLMLRFKKKIPNYEYDEKKIKIDKSKIMKEIPKNKFGNGGFTVGFFIRMLYSSLVDADFLDTEDFIQIDKDNIRGGYESFSDLTEKFDIYMEDKSKKVVKSILNGYRQQIFNDCVKAAEQKTNLFSLTVPTGGGKTLASMAFALKHLKYNNMKKIICVIPYTSIIEQNAKVYKNIFGEKSVLEHHSNFDFSINGNGVKEEAYSMQKLKYASENWDIPIIVTTNVQFFESLFANKSSRCRKLHNISNSIVIIDEAQMIPIKFLKPSLAAINELVNNYNTSVVLTTATKPDFPENLLSQEPIEIINNPETLYKALNRVEVEFIEQLSDEKLASNINELNQVLVIVNTRNHAQKLYEHLPKKNLFHLSAKMCSKHRTEILEEIRVKLKNHESCKVISTQLIECGVDISFPVVYRSLTGIDSIAQAAGRCNREGELDKGKVYVFNSTEDYGKAIMFQSRTAECGRQVLKNFEDPLSLDAISEYFNLLYDVEKDRLDVKNIMENFEEGAKDLVFNFNKTAKDYKLINETESLIIPFDKAADDIIEALKYTQYPNSQVRKLQPYTISIHEIQLKKLIDEGVITIISGRFYVLSCKEGFYDKNTGLVLGNKEMLII
ncbi:CRISPR-associated helicase Cas3' [Clostridium sp.]|uniref:CRISPR-associated helicase Cas3' n=1 Tax=Clostridium sp. TaxID=1506 RepID=UPI003D6D4D31